MGLGGGGVLGETPDLGVAGSRIFLPRDEQSSHSEHLGGSDLKVPNGLVIGRS